MIEETGRVVGLETGFAWVEAEPRSGCGECTARKGCGTSAIARMLGQRSVRIRVLNRIDARPGDRVVIAGQAGLKDNVLVSLPGDEDPDDDGDEADDKVTETAQRISG